MLIMAIDGGFTMEHNLIDDCKKYLGIYPYNTWTNIVVYDLYFYEDMCKKYGEQNVANAIKKLKG